MKIKADFVTNSSSSAFVVFFDKKIEKEQDLIDMNIEMRFIEQIFKDCKEQHPIQIHEVSKEAIQRIADNIEGADLPGIPDFWDYEDTFCREQDITEEEFAANPVWRQQMWRVFEEKRKVASIMEAKRLVKENEGKYVYFFEYADEDGSFFAALEHENDWGTQEYVRISKH